jgi:flagellar export protein FliJ
MPAFRFRAAAALDLRRQQETTAGAALAREQARLTALRATRDDVDRARREAQDRALSQERHGTDGASLLWHRNWIVNLGTTVDRLAGDCDRQTAVLRDAERAWHDARRRRLALERMRDRAWRRYEDTERRRELKELDELARVRHAAIDDRSGRHDRDD